MSDLENFLRPKGKRKTRTSRREPVATEVDKFESGSVLPEPDRTEDKTEPQREDRAKRSVIQPIWASRSKGEVIELLEETVVRLPLFTTHLGWTRAHILPETPSVSPERLAVMLNIPLAEALVILHRLETEQQE